MNFVSLLSFLHYDDKLIVYNRFHDLLFSGSVHELIELCEPMIDVFCINTINRISVRSDCIIVTLF